MKGPLHSRPLLFLWYLNRIHISKSSFIQADDTEIAKSTRLPDLHESDQGFPERLYILDRDVPSCSCSGAASLVSVVSHLLHILSQCDLSCQLVPSCSPTAGHLPPSCLVWSTNKSKSRLNTCWLRFSQLNCASSSKHADSLICTRALTKTLHIKILTGSGCPQRPTTTFDGKWQIYTFHLLP